MYCIFNFNLQEMIAHSLFCVGFFIASIVSSALFSSALFIGGAIGGASGGASVVLEPALAALVCRLR